MPYRRPVGRQSREVVAFLKLLQRQVGGIVAVYRSREGAGDGHRACCCDGIGVLENEA
jgi:hypothetical protein